MSLVLLKNTTLGVLGEFATRGSKIVQLILIARLLGAEEVGRINHAVAFVGLFSVLLDFGIVPVAIKALAAAPDSPALRLYGRLKLLTSSIGILLLGIVLLLSNKIPPKEGWIIFGMGSYLALNDLGVFITVAYRAKDEFWRESIWRSISALVQLGACTAALLLTRSIGMLVLSLIGSAVICTAPLFIEWQRQPSIKPESAGWSGIYSALRQCLPLAGTVLIGSVYMNLDVVVLGNYTSMEEVGWYSVVIKVVFSLMIMPIHYMQLATLPAFAACPSPAALNSRWLRGFVLSTSMGAVISVGTAMLSGPILASLFGASFAAAAPVLVMFTLVGFMFYVYTPLSQWLLLHDRQKSSLWIYFVGMLVNLVAVFMLVPIWGLWGAVSAAFCTHATIALIHSLLVLRHENIVGNRTALLALLRLTLGTTTAVTMILFQVGGALICMLIAATVLLIFANREILELTRHLISVYQGLLAQISSQSD